MAIEIDNDNGEIRVDGYEYAASKVNVKTYSISSEVSQAGNSADLRITDSDGYIDSITFSGGSNVSIVRTDGNTITISSGDIDTNTTYALSAETSLIPDSARLRLTGSDGYTDDIVFVGGTSIQVVRSDASTLTINSLQNSFSSITDGYSTAVADQANDTLGIVSGPGINATINALNDSLTIANTGVRSFNGAAGVVTYNSFGTVTDGYTPVVADQGNDTLTISAGTGIGISVDAQTDSLTISNSGVTQNIAGTGILVSGATGNVTITNNGVTSFNGSGGSITYNNFTNFTDGVNTATPDTTTDTFTFSAGTGISAIVNSTTDTVTIAMTEGSRVVSPDIAINSQTTSPVFVINNVAPNASFEFRAVIMAKFNAAGAGNTYSAVLSSNQAFASSAAGIIFGPNAAAEITSNSTSATSPVVNDSNIHAVVIDGIIRNGANQANIGISFTNNSAVNTLSILTKSFLKFNFI
jgi:hypothetical protein